MCNYNCCQNRSPIGKRLAARRLLELQEEEARRPKLVIPTPQSLFFKFDTVEAMAMYIINVSHIRPKYGLISGKFLGSMMSLVERAVIIPHSDIPNFPASQEDPNDSFFVVGFVRGAPIIAMSNRCLYYEGQSLANCALPVQVMRLCGVKTIILSCFGASVNPSYKVGDIMMIKDHINMVGMLNQTAMEGPSDPRFGRQHLRMVDAYDEELMEKSFEIGEELGIGKSLRSGIFACIGGPLYLTLAEERLFRSLGVDAMGMSLIPEVIAAHQGGLKVFAFVIITVPANDKAKEEDDADLDPRLARMKKEVLDVPWPKVQACHDLIAHLLYYMHHRHSI
ncbi:hypothetical protein KR054_005019 [Drosophila jambulina]|nr:hypothetical protein KR054_005019 [Drosophila jambulina]